MSDKNIHPDLDPMDCRDSNCKCRDEVCFHGVIFDLEDAKKLNSVEAVRKKYPRRWWTDNNPCKCGFVGIAYASMEHFLYGDW